MGSAKDDKARAEAQIAVETLEAKAGTHCGGNKASCQACGSHATWCKAEEGHCCLAAKDPDDFCGTCFGSAIAGPSSHCGGSEKNCHRCGGRAKWCKPKPR